MAVAVRTLDNFIGGEWRPAGGDRIREIASPVTGEVLAEVADASSAELDAAVAAARAAQPKWAALSAWDRAKVCHAIADLIVERREPFAHALSLEQGKPNSVFDNDGSSLVVHAKADDYKTDPAGNAGDRIACGVIQQSGAATVGSAPVPKK